MEFTTIEPSASTPLIKYDAETRVLSIIGESYPENSFDFYAPLISWLRTNLTTLTSFTLDITITYMNSSSTKCAFDIMDIMEEAFGRNVNTLIIWRYDRDNPRSYEMAEDFREEVTFPFQIEAIEH